MTQKLLRPPTSGKFVKHQFQLEDLDYLIQLDASSNWSEMGSLKTSTAEWLMEYKLKHIPNPRVLVITNKTGKGTYFESLPEVLPTWDVFNMTTTKVNPVIGGKVVPINVELPNPLYMRPIVVMAHYHCFTNRACQPRQKMGPGNQPILNPDTQLFEMIVPFCTQLLTAHWDMVICDEAHRLKNYNAQWTRNIKKLKAEFKHIMTGTGIVNNPAELWSLLHFLYPKTYTSHDKFKRTYCDIDTWSGYQKVVGIKRGKEQELREMIRRVGVRRTMIECFPNISEPIETTIPVDLNPAQQKMYDEIKDTLQTLDAAGTPLHSPNVLSMLNRLRQICVATPEVLEDYYDHKEERRIIKVKLREPSSKLDAVMDIIDGLEWDSERQDQVVVFSQFKDPLELLQHRLAKKNIPYLRLLAEMSDEKRYQMWHDIWPAKKHQVFLTTLSLGSESINLTSANRAIFLDQSWSPAQNKQAIGRVYRPGQTGVAQLIYIRAEDTVDYRILTANQEKNGWFQTMFGSG